MNRIGYGATGYTTAKLAVGHSLVYAALTESYDVETASRYARSNQEAIEQVARIVSELSIECDFERASNYVYTELRESVARIEREVEAARAAGVEAELTTDTDLPYPIAGAVKVAGQAQFHPWKYLAGLARAVDGDGSHVFESTRATRVRSGSPCVVETAHARVRAGHVIVATQLPFLDRGLFFAKAHPTTSYAIAAAVDEGSAPRGMYISVDQPTRSVRSTAGEDGGRIVIVGGEGHKPGAEPDTRRCYERLETFLADRFGATAEYRWSTHDYDPLDKLPYIGRLRRGDERILIATGFAKWGMTKGTLAASMLTDAILGRQNEYEDLYDANRVDPRRAVATFAKENAGCSMLLPRSARADRARRRSSVSLQARASSPESAESTTPSRAETTAGSSRCPLAAPTSAASSAGTRPTVPGSVPATAPATRQTGRSSRGPPRRTYRVGTGRERPPAHWPWRLAELAAEADRDPAIDHAERVHRGATHRGGL